ncbi:MAG: complex I subunit 5 family protein [Thermosphaera sp.]
MLSIAPFVFYISGALLFVYPGIKRETGLPGMLLLKVSSAVLLSIGAYSSLIAGETDLFGCLLALTTIVLGSLISLYGAEYFRLNNYSKSANILLDLLVVSLFLTFTSYNVILLASFWTLSEILAFALIKEGEEHSYEGSLTSSRGFIFTSTLTFEVTVFTLIITSVLLVAGSIRFENLLTPFPVLASAGMPVQPYLIPLLLAGFITKAAIIPLHFWLPSAHTAAPSPASALLSGVMTLLGFLGLYRLKELVDFGEYLPVITAFLVIAGITSIIYGGIQSINQRDGKRMLAYATISTNGFISLVFALYISYPSSISLLALTSSIIMHTAYKTTLFAETGLIEYSYGTRYIHGLHDVSTHLPISSLGGLMAVFTMLGLPGSIGFTSKLLSIYATLYEGLDSLKTIIILGIALYIAVTIAISITYFKIYLRKSRSVLQPVKMVNHRTQAYVLALGSLNILFNLLVMVTEFTTIVLITFFTMLIPVLVSLLFYTAIRGVKPREHAG